MREINICVLAGDGIGKEVTDWGVKALETAGKYHDLAFNFHHELLGHAAIQATGNPLPEATLARCKSSDAVLLGAIGDPHYDLNPHLKVRPEQGLLALRKGLGLFANIRPILLFDELLDASSLKREIIRGTDILFFRELTGGIYFGEPRGRKENDTVAFDTKIYSKFEVERIARMAFEAARSRKKILHSVDKANVLESSRLWREVVQQLAPEYPEVEVIHLYVDNAAMQLIKNPKQFDVVLTGNMFGDILTDEASQIAGSLGMLASASLGNKVGLFEPIHGSAPDIAGKNLANPLATILSTALMCNRSLNATVVGQLIVDAVDTVLKEGYRTRDIMDKTTDPNKILGTREMGTQVLNTIHTIANNSVLA